MVQSRGIPHHLLSIKSMSGVATKPIQPFQAIYSSSGEELIHGFGNGEKVCKEKLMIPIYPVGKQIPCSSPGCCLSFPSIRDLAQHLRTHCPPTQSLEGRMKAGDSEEDRVEDSPQGQS